MIYGYKQPKVRLYYSAARLNAFLSFSHEGVVTDLAERDGLVSVVTHCTRCCTDSSTPPLAVFLCLDLDSVHQANPLWPRFHRDPSTTAFYVPVLHVVK